MQQKKNSVTPAEWEVLEVLFGCSPLSAREVYEQLPGYGGSPQTVRTLLERLLGKGILEREDSHGMWVFRPACDRQAIVREEGRGFLRRFFDGQAGLGAAYFIQNESLSEEELRRLRELLDKKLGEVEHDA